MCRYAFHTYKDHYACFACRKAFKKTPIEDYLKQKGLAYQYARLLGLKSKPDQLEELEANLGMTLAGIEETYLREVAVCPDCGGPMAAMGLDFRPPKQSNIEAWEILAVLYDHGFAFAGCGCNINHPPPPHRRSDLSAWLDRHSRKSEGQLLLAAIQTRHGPVTARR